MIFSMVFGTFWSISRLEDKDREGHKILGFYIKLRPNSDILL